MTLRHAFPIVVALVFVVGVRTVEAQCSFSVAPTTVSAPSFGTTSSLSVITGSSCTWTATSSVNWITITSFTGRGLGQVNFMVAENTSGAVRVGTITAAGVAVTVTQAVSSCVYSILPGNVSPPLGGSSYTLSVTTGSSCPWTATTATSWITITAGASGNGIGSVSFTVATTTTPRTGTLTVAGQTVTVAQGGGQAPPEAPTNLRIIR